MPKPLVYEVLPIDSTWVVRIASDSQSEAFEAKADALSRARQLAARDGAVVRVLSATGRVESEFAPPGSGART
ncbi:MAG TPA: DUF2188 domain-containing protein [Polyangiaceae bacterium]|nr:DUF2188 domain-containing protein [Polyangiaceae bacterium]